MRFSACDTLVLPEYQMVQDSGKLYGIRQKKNIYKTEKTIIAYPYGTVFLSNVKY